MAQNNNQDNAVVTSTSSETIANADSSADYVGDVYAALRRVDSEATKRNQYMKDRDDALYDNGLFNGIKIPVGFDRTEYNFLTRVVDIHSSQVMGQGFTVFSTFDKTDLSTLGTKPNQQVDPDLQKSLDNDKFMAEIDNKKHQVAAEARRQTLMEVFRQNGGRSIFQKAVRIGSSYGESLMKVWYDNKAEKIKISVIESPQNWRAIWKSSDFRDRDADAYMYQISEGDAYRNYGSKLPEGAKFQVTYLGAPLDVINTTQTIPATQNTNSTPMCNCVDLTGMISGWKSDGSGNLVKCSIGQETKVSAMIVGGFLVQVIDKEEDLPVYYRVPNIVEPRRPYGASDLPDSALDINRTYIQTMSDWITLQSKILFPLIKGKGFDSGSLPRKNPREMTVVPMGLDQDLQVLDLLQGAETQVKDVLGKLEENFIRVTRVSRPMFDDPSINPNSNQAIITLMQPLVDITQEKQARWAVVLQDMCTDILNLLAAKQPDIKKVVDPDEVGDWHLEIKWPSSLRKEDASYQTMYLNRFHAGTISLASYLEAMGEENVQEEINKIRDEMADPVTAAILGNARTLLATQVITPPVPQDVKPDVKIQLKGELSPNQEANLASQQGFNDGPFPASAGPQGNAGQTANDNANNAGNLTAPAYEGGTPIQTGPDGQPLTPPPGTPGPQLSTPAQNQPGTGPVSQPGSGATPVSAEGALAQGKQRRGA